MYPPRVIGKAIKHVQMYFKVQTNQIVKQLVEKELEFRTENNISVTTKIMGLEYTRKVAFLTGISLKIVSATWYRDEIQKQLGILEGIIEIKKETIY